ncbi:MAG: hypothetical protein ABWX90_02555 [Candidatus Saccharimonadales bacterium]
MRLRRLRSLHPKKLVIILTCVLLVVIGVSVYAFWSKSVWDAYQPSYINQHQNLKNDINKLVKAPTTTSDDRKVVLSGLEHASQQTDMSSQTMCRVHSAVAWQTKVWRNLESAQAACVETMTNLSKIGSPLQKATAYIKDDNKLAAILAAVPQSGELADDAWQSQIDSWQKAETEASAMTVSPAFSPVKKLAVSQLSAVKAAWQAVVAAHQAKDKTKYLAAQDNLATALDELNEIPILSEKELGGLTEELAVQVSEALDS